MMCQCGNRYPDDSPYCPYCGTKNTMMRTRPKTLINGTGSEEPEPFQGYYVGGGRSRKGGCLSRVVRTVLALVLTVVVAVLIFMAFGVAIDNDPSGVFHDLQEMWGYVERSF